MLRSRGFMLGLSPIIVTNIIFLVLQNCLKFMFEGQGFKSLLFWAGTFLLSDSIVNRTYTFDHRYKLATTIQQNFTFLQTTD